MKISVQGRSGKWHSSESVSTMEELLAEQDRLMTLMAELITYSPAPPEVTTNPKHTIDRRG